MKKKHREGLSDLSILWFIPLVLRKARAGPRWSWAEHCLQVSHVGCRGRSIYCHYCLEFLSCQVVGIWRWRWDVNLWTCEPRPSDTRSRHLNDQSKYLPYCGTFNDPSQVILTSPVFPLSHFSGAGSNPGPSIAFCHLTSLTPPILASSLPCLIVCVFGSSKESW